MRFVPLATTALVTGVVLAASPSRAEVTALDVWNSWKTLAGTYSQTVEVESDTFENGVLTLTGVTTTMELPEGGTAVGTLSELVLTEHDDGTVTFTMPEEYPFTFEALGSDREKIAMAMRFLQENLDIVASGEPDAISYVFSAPKMTFILDEFTENGRAVDMVLSATMNAADGTYIVEAGSPQTILSTLKADTVDIELSVNEPDEDVNFDMTMTIADIDSSSNGTISPFAGGQDLATMLHSGFSTEGTMTAGRSTFEVSADDGESPFTLTGGSESGSLDMVLNPDGVTYSGRNVGVSAALEMETMPFPPFTLDIAETTGEVRMPMIASEENKDFGLVIGMKDLDLGEEVWAMFDPTGGLARTPANLTVDISGLGRWTTDISDPATLAETTDEIPGEVESLSLNQLVLSMLGAELTGSGDFSFDNATAPPAPAGLINLKLTGANAVIDNLVATGLLPEDQAMGARMMLGLFAEPGAGNDELISTIEVKEDGSVLANGQRIR